MHRPNRGFTLIELLVVIAVIGLLVSILLPSLAKAKMLTRELVCQTNIHSMARASQLYAAEYNGYVPRDYYTNNRDRSSGNFGHWQFANRLAPYLGGPEIPFEYDEDSKYMYNVFAEMEVYQCPGITDPGEHVLHYVVNGVDFDRYTEEGRWSSSPVSRIEDVPGSASEVFYIAEANIDQLSAKNFKYHDVFGPGHMPFDGWVPRMSSRMVHPEDLRHQGRTTLVFFDGHTEPRQLHPEQLPVTLLHPDADKNLD